jgi:hypothetical protein
VRQVPDVLAAERAALQGAKQRGKRQPPRVMWEAVAFLEATLYQPAEPPPGTSTQPLKLLFGTSLLLR